MLRKWWLICWLSILLAACAKVPAGYRGVIVYLYGSSRGISEESVGVGRYWMGWNREMFLFPVFLQNYTWIDKEIITMQTQEGLTISTDAGITYQIRPENVVKVFQRYRLGIEEITNTFLRNMVRDAMNQIASTMSIEEIYGAKKETFIAKVNEIVKAQALAAGIEVDKIYLVGTFQLPSTVVDSINSKIQATQNAMRAQNEVATSTAEAQKVIIKAQAEAKANEVISKSITPEYLQYMAVQKWNGTMPQVTGNATPFVSIPNAK
jgi:regulator of protease activity HflC (stomatin/prohibitin superfamily)